MNLIDKTERPKPKLKWTFKVRAGDKLVRSFESKHSYSVRDARTISSTLFDLSKVVLKEAVKVTAVSNEGDKIQVPVPITQSVWSSLYAQKYLGG
jgi:hypothetical protein